MPHLHRCCVYANHKSTDIVSPILQNLQPTRKSFRLFQSFSHFRARYIQPELLFRQKSKHFSNIGRERFDFFFPIYKCWPIIRPLFQSPPNYEMHPLLLHVHEGRQHVLATIPVILGINNTYHRIGPKDEAHFPPRAGSLFTIPIKSTESINTIINGGIITTGRYQLIEHTRLLRKQRSVRQKDRPIFGHFLIRRMQRREEVHAAFHLRRIQRRFVGVGHAHFEEDSWVSILLFGILIHRVIETLQDG
mmetsp:Transcript_26934/g.57987  ORF Transcript_26934/g.57987 Transcript_26934/m.57987 type:complete len:248 (+) Transcript_26934:228-971(+)